MIEIVPSKLIFNLSIVYRSSVLTRFEKSMPERTNEDRNCLKIRYTRSDIDFILMESLKSIGWEKVSLN